MKTAIYLALYSCFFSVTALAQTPKETPTFNIIQNQPLEIHYENIEELQSDKLIPNAFSIQLNTSPKPYRIYCQLVCSGAPNEAFAQLISLKQQTNNVETQLSTNPKILYTQQANQNPTIINFNAIIRKQTSWFPTGNYTFSIQFTTIEP